MFGHDKTIIVVCLLADHRFDIFWNSSRGLTVSLSRIVLKFCAGNLSQNQEERHDDRKRYQQHRKFRVKSSRAIVFTFLGKVCVVCADMTFAASADKTSFV